MIVTVTLNPAIDIAYPLNTLSLNTVNRVKEMYKTAGGKGLNVTRVLHQLNEPVLATGLLGGSSGTWIQEQLDSIGVEHDFHRITGETRSCIALLHDQQQTEILEAGPTVSTAEWHMFLKHFEKLISHASVVVISGSLPKGLSFNEYVQLLTLCHAYDRQIVLDCAGDVLSDVLSTGVKPTVIKPNMAELQQLIVDKDRADMSDLKQVLDQECLKEIECVFVSLGAQGAFVKCKNKYYRVCIPQIRVVNPVGSGDSVVAGIASALLNGETDECLIRKSMSLGMLNSQENQTGFVNMENYDNLFKQVEIVEV